MLRTSDTDSPDPHSALNADTLLALAQHIKRWGQELGFDAVGISDVDLHEAEAGLQSWLDAGYHGDMDYMEKHGTKRARPAELVPGTLRVISVRLPYLPSSLLVPGEAPDASGIDSKTEAATYGVITDATPVKAVRADKRSGDDIGAAHTALTVPAPVQDWRDREALRLEQPGAAVVSVYARGRDYHKVLRQRLQRLADRITEQIGPFGYRVFTDSAPVMEVELARRAGVGWRGKHTLLLARDAGSFFFLGELYVDVLLPTDADVRATQPPPVRLLPAEDGENCGQCRRCLDACPTGAIVAPYRLDARRCISYLTIEYKGSIPEEMRAAIGNRIYGCDDCQTVCPWNKFAKVSPVPDFDTRNGLDRSSLVALFAWTEQEFETRLEGSAIRRIGHILWLRNIAVAMGNALRNTSADLANGERQNIVHALEERRAHASPLVREHIEWALRGSVVCTDVAIDTHVDTDTDTDTDSRP